MTGAVFDSNEANTDGGGLAVVGPLPAANITNTTFTANKAAGSGGAIFHQVRLPQHVTGVGNLLGSNTCKRQWRMPADDF